VRIRSDRPLATLPRVASPSALARQVDGAVSVPARDVRIVGGVMLAVAAVRPLVSFQFVPPCPLRTITGIPCPLCGMTRGVTAIVHGDIARAAFLNPGSLIVVALAILLLVQWRMRRIVVPVWVIFTVLAVLWTWQLFKYSTGRAL
jgi:Protein of unknown function (DUF2752)